ncbi:GRAM domain-containing protein 2A-like [Tiliqua scincoides]|uniref:GRAM domain-containing protein 2A-like n=1 Tax=Tiliqua scincoides TaxID=71010 RepID=UPI0034626BAC
MLWLPFDVQPQEGGCQALQWSDSESLQIGSSSDPEELCPALTVGADDSTRGGSGTRSLKSGSSGGTSVAPSQVPLLRWELNKASEGGKEEGRKEGRTGKRSSGPPRRLLPSFPTHHAGIGSARIRLAQRTSRMVKLGVSTGPESLDLANISDVPDLFGKHRKSKKKMAEQKKSQSLEEPLNEGPRNGPNPPLSRSKTYDPSFSKEVEKEAALSQHKSAASNLMKHASNFHHVFKDLSEEEALLDTFSCAWQRDVPYHGRLYISHHHVCFYCSMLRREVKVIIPVPTISVLKKANTALLVPNAIRIRTTEGEKFLFGSLRSRDSTYQLLRSICKHLPDGSQNGSPSTSHTSSEHLLKISLTSREFDPSHNLPEDEEVPDGATRIEKPSTIQLQQQQVATSRGRGQVKKSSTSWWDNLNLLNIVILIYLFLVVVLLLSSGYIGLRIVQLEEQLTSMGAWPEFDLQHRLEVANNHHDE